MPSSPTSDEARRAPGPALPCFEDVLDAEERLRGVIVHTPLLRSPSLDRDAGRPVLIKAECLQTTGSFKARGAYNRLSRLCAAERRRGVVTYSSGNHGQAVAWAGHRLAVSAAVVMPDDAPALKREGTARWGAEIVPYTRGRQSREEVAAALAQARGAILVRPYDDPLVIAGQGTVGLELADHVLGLGQTPDAVLIPAGGGGLAAGCALALAARLSGVPVFTVEPEGYDDHARSLAAGRRLSLGEPRPETACDALRAPTPGEITFAINAARLAGGLVVSEAEVARAVRVAFRTLKIVLEPSGAVGLAAVLAGAVPAGDGPVAVIASGGNVDETTFARILSRPSPP